MKKVILRCLILVLIFSSCESNKTYQYVEFVTSGGIDVLKIDSGIIKATNDSTAYLIAYEKHCNNSKSMMDIEEAFDDNTSTDFTDYRFSLYNENKVDIASTMQFNNKVKIEKEIYNKIFSLSNSFKKDVEDMKKKEIDNIDSIDKVEQNIAIGDIKFGISKKEFDNKIMKFLDKCELPEYEFYMQKTMFRYKLGEYGFRDFNYQFYHDSLYEIDFTGGRVKYDDYEDVMPVQFDALFKILKEKYSKPSRSIGLPNWNDLHKNDRELCATWSIGSKQISIFITCKGTEYSLDLDIYKPSVVNIIDKENRDKKKQSIKNAAKIL